MLIVRVFASKDWFVCKDVNYKAVVVKDFNQVCYWRKQTFAFISTTNENAMEQMN